MKSQGITDLHYTLLHKSIHCCFWFNYKSALTYIDNIRCVFLIEYHRIIPKQHEKMQNISQLSHSNPMIDLRASGPIGLLWTAKVTLPWFYEIPISRRMSWFRSHIVNPHRNTDNTATHVRPICCTQQITDRKCCQLVNSCSALIMKSQTFRIVSRWLQQRSKPAEICSKMTRWIPKKK